MLVGRERQIVQVRSHVDALVAGRGGLILVGGDAGLGKTSLAEAAMDLAASAGTELIQFSPTDLLAQTEAAIAKGMQDAAN